MLNMYSSWMPDAPQLNNTWGQLNAVLNWCLVDDSAELKITSIESTNQIGILKVNAPPETIIKFMKDMTVSISGSFYTELTEKPFLVIEVGVGYMKITRTNFPTEIITDVSENLTIKRISAGMKRVFGGVEGGKTVFSTGDDKFFLRVDDTNPTIGGKMSTQTWTETWYKMARVMISTGFESLDEVSGIFAPVANIPAQDSANLNPSGDITGVLKWYYNPVWDDGTSSVAENRPLTRFNNAWTIFANDKVMYLIIYANTSLSVRTYNYMFGQFESNDQTFPYNCLLNAWYRYYSYSTVYTSLAAMPPHTAPFLNRSFSTTLHKVMLRSFNGVYTGNSVKEYSLDFGYSSSGNSMINYPNPMDNMISINDVLVYADNNLYGKYIGIKWISNNVIGQKIANNTTFKYLDDNNQDNYYKFMTLSEEGTTYTNHTSVMFDLTK